MKHWTPWIAEAVEQALVDGAERLVGLVLAPHYSRLSIGGYRDRLEEALDGRAELAFVESWHDYEPYVELLAERVRGTDAHVVFTAHSLPERILAEGDPYRDQLLETSRLVAERAGRRRRGRSPSRARARPASPGSAPTSSSSSRRCTRRASRKVLVAPVGFVCDHLEILWDLDVEAREKAAELGLELDRIESLERRPRVRPRTRGPRGEGLSCRSTNREPMSSTRSCPDWPVLLEVAPDLHFKHYTLGEARLPAEVLVNLPDIPIEAVAICADLEHNVFNPHHTDPRVARRCRTRYWYALSEWSQQAPPA